MVGRGSGGLQGFGKTLTPPHQVKLFSGIRHMMIHVVANGIVMPYLLDRNLETHLPVLPPEVDEVRFRWRAGKRKYRYNFYRLESHDQVEIM